MSGNRESARGALPAAELERRHFNPARRVFGPDHLHLGLLTSAQRDNRPDDCRDAHEADAIPDGQSVPSEYPSAAAPVLKAPHATSSFGAFAGVSPSKRVTRRESERCLLMQVGPKPVHRTTTVPRSICSTLPGSPKGRPFKNTRSPAAKTGEAAITAAPAPVLRRA